MTTLAGLLNHLRARFDAERVPFVVGGAFALAAHGHPRFTDDVDVMVLVSDLAPVHRALGAERFERINEVTFRDNETGLFIDVIPVEDEAQRAAFDGARKVPIEGATGVPVLSAEGLALMLLREATRGDQAKRSLRLRDVELLASGGKLDWSFVREWASRMGYDDAYRAIGAAGKPPLD